MEPLEQRFLSQWVAGVVATFQGCITHSGSSETREAKDVVLGVR